MNQSIDMAKLAYAALEEKKAEDIRIIKIDEVSTIADYFIIANGKNITQISALLDGVQEALSKQGYEPKRVEGHRSTSWILLDYGDVIIHIFSKEDRLFYDLERIWKDGKEIVMEQLK